VLLVIKWMLWFRPYRDRQVQKILDKVIASGFYYNLMCYAIHAACDNNIISNEERKLAISEISKYVGKHWSLERKLDSMWYHYTFQDRLRVYKDWKNRPE
jgi:hypothetical protein